jgi:hypothetical protein
MVIQDINLLSFIRMDCVVIDVIMVLPMTPGQLPELSYQPDSPCASGFLPVQ